MHNINNEVSLNRPVDRDEELLGPSVSSSVLRSVQEIDSKNHNKIPFFVVGSSSMEAHMRRLGWERQRVDRLMAGRRTSAVHGKDLDIAVATRNVGSMARQLSGDTTKRQVKVGDEIVDLMEREVYPGFELDNIDGVWMQRSDEMLFEKAEALVDVVQKEKQAKWGYDLKILEQVIRDEQELDSDNAVDAYLDRRYSEYNKVRLQQQIKTMNAYLADHPNKTVGDIVKQKTIQATLPHANELLISSLMSANSELLDSAALYITPDMYNQWYDVKNEAGKQYNYIISRC